MYDAKPMPTVKSLTKMNREPGKQGMQRLAMLNKLFMKNITDLMSTGTVAMGIVGRGIEISKVSLYSFISKLHKFRFIKKEMCYILSLLGYNLRNFTTDFTDHDL